MLKLLNYDVSFCKARMNAAMNGSRHMLCNRCISNTLCNHYTRNTLCNQNLLKANQNILLIRKNAGVVSEKPPKFPPIQNSLLWTLRKRIGFPSKYSMSEEAMDTIAKRLLLCCLEYTDFELFRNEFELSDTFMSWFYVVIINVWMMCLRLAHLGEDGCYIAYALLKYLWIDLDKRHKALGASKPGIRRQDFDIMHCHLIVSFWSYDEGILSDDKVLANAVWRMLFLQYDVDPRYLDKVVGYIRRQVHVLFSYDADVFYNDVPRFIALDGDHFDISVVERIKTVANSL